MTTQIQTIDAQVAEIVTGSQLANANELVTAFLPIAKEAQEAIADFMMISVTSVDDKEGMKRAREARLRIRELRLRTEQARKSRQSIFARAAAVKMPIAGAHLPFPGAGHLETEGQGYRWVPLKDAR